VIKEARRRQYLRWAQSAAAAAIVLAGLAVGALAMLSGGGSVHRGARRDPVRPAGPPRSAASFGVRLTPSLDGGSYGWCVGVQERSGGIAGGGCAMTPVASSPLAFTLSEGGARTRTWSVVVLTTPQVAAVLVNARERVRTQALHGLPYGLRAARIVLPLPPRKSHGRRRIAAPPPEPTLVALGADGRALPSTGAPVPEGGVRLAASGPCALRAVGLPGLTPQWSHIASAITAFPGRIVGQAFFSCVDTEYSWQKWPLDAAILLDAQHPGAPPAPIPGMQAVKTAPGYFNGPGDFKGELTAVRRGDAWLVIAGGKSLSQRLAVLRHLKAAVRLPT
jgi:hypothetical protein